MINTVIVNKNSGIAQIISGENVVCSVRCESYTKEKTSNGNELTILKIRNEICPVINADVIEVESEIECDDAVAKVIRMAWSAKHVI